MAFLFKSRTQLNDYILCVLAFSFFVRLWNATKSCVTHQNPERSLWLQVEMKEKMKPKSCNNFFNTVHFHWISSFVIFFLGRLVLFLLNCDFLRVFFSNLVCLFVQPEMANTFAFEEHTTEMAVCIFEPVALFIFQYHPNKQNETQKENRRDRKICKRKYLWNENIENRLTIFANQIRSRDEIFISNNFCLDSTIRSASSHHSSMCILRWMKWFSKCVWKWYLNSNNGTHTKKIVNPKANTKMPLVEWKRKCWALNKWSMESSTFFHPLNVFAI